tara:strand:- start:38 stop:397 length:360 start_codon:yes stop_codon:yes gene_type:complete
MSVNLIVLKSGEELIADVKEIKSGNEVVGYYFDDPLRLNFNPEQEPEVLQENENTLKYNAKVSITFFPWVPFAAQRKQIPCSADWIVTIVEPQKQLIKLYEEKVNGRNESDQSPVVINE